MTGRDQLHVLASELRELCDVHGVEVEIRGRLTLAATLVVRALDATEATVSGQLSDDADGSATLTVTLQLNRVIPARLDLPLSSESHSDHEMTWRLSAHPPGQPVVDPELAVEQELRAAFAHVDTLEREYRELKHELAETNSGVVAMFVEHEERDERLRSAHAIIFRELEDALRPPPPSVPGLEFGVHYEPADADAPTGGDLYDWFLLPDGTVHITVVDAVGHGVVCTRTALTVCHTLRTLALEGHPLATLIRRTSDLTPGLMATVLLARLDPRTGKFTLASGGHPPALLVPAHGEPSYLPLRGRGVGFPDPGSQEVREEFLARGDTLMMYTDGLVEGGHDYIEDEARLSRTTEDHRITPAGAAARIIVEQMHDVVVHTDDTLLLVIRRMNP